MPGLALHPFAHDRERFGRHRAVRRQVIRTLDVDRIDRRRLGELHQVDDARRLGPDLGDVLFRHDDVAPLFEFVALGHFRHRHFAFAGRAPALLLDSRLAFGMELVEADRGRRIRRRKHPHRDVYQADFEKALPCRTCGHIDSLISRFRVRGSGCGFRVPGSELATGNWQLKSPKRPALDYRPVPCRPA